MKSWLVGILLFCFTVSGCENWRYKDEFVFSGEAYRFTRALRKETGFAFNMADRVFQEYVYGFTADGKKVRQDLFLEKLNICYGGNAAFVREGIDSNGNFVLGLFVDVKLQRNPRPLCALALEIHGDSLEIGNDYLGVGDTLIAIATFDRYRYDFSIWEWQELVENHYRSLLAQIQ